MLKDLRKYLKGLLEIENKLDKLPYLVDEKAKKFFDEIYCLFTEEDQRIQTLLYEFKKEESKKN